MADNEMKICSKCHKEKPAFRYGRKGGTCLDCWNKYMREYNARDYVKEYRRKYRKQHRERCNEYNKKWRENNPEKYKASKRKQRYGLLPNEYQNLIDYQGGRCAVCNCFPLKGSSLVVDHNHINNKVRGLLCNNCNRALGLLRDNIKIVEMLKKYLLARG